MESAFYKNKQTFIYFQSVCTSIKGLHIPAVKMAGFCYTEKKLNEGKSRLNFSHPQCEISTYKN